MSNSIVQTTKKKLINLSRHTMFQGFWESLLNKSLVGMNYWGGARFSESGELDAVQKMLSGKENIVFFDVGANNGGFAVAVSEVLDSSAKIYCFEPLPSMYQQLSQATVEKNNISTYNIGLGDKEETLEIFYVTGKEELTSLYGNIPDREFNASENVEISTVDSFLKNNNIPKITYLKIDVEGHELKVVEGAKESIESGKIDYIQFEFGESMIDSRVFFRDFWDLLSERFIIYRILPSGMREIKHYSEQMEIFHCINFIAVNKSVI